MWILAQSDHRRQSLDRESRGTGVGPRAYDSSDRSGPLPQSGSPAFQISILDRLSVNGGIERELMTGGAELCSLEFPNAQRCRVRRAGCCRRAFPSVPAAHGDDDRAHGRLRSCFRHSAAQTTDYPSTHPSTAEKTPAFALPRGRDSSCTPQPRLHRRWPALNPRSRERRHGRGAMNAIPQSVRRGRIRNRKVAASAPPMAILPAAVPVVAKGVASIRPAVCPVPPGLARRNPQSGLPMPSLMYDAVSRRV